MCSDRSSEKAFSFLEGVNPDTLILTEIEKDASDMVYSQNSGLIYVVFHSLTSGFKWDENNKTFKKQFEISIQDTTHSFIWSITLAPPDTSGGEQIYISVGSGNPMKEVYRLGGRKLEKRVLLSDTMYINDECLLWNLASNTDRHILLIHPLKTPFIYIHVKEQKHGKVDLNQLDIRKGRISTISGGRIQLIGQLFILGDQSYNILCMYELIVTESDALIKSGNETVRVESDGGRFAALSHVVGHQDEQVHLFTAITYKGRGCTYISEYILNTSVSGSELQHLPMQPIHTLQQKREFCTLFHPHCLVNVNYYSSVLIGIDSLYKRGNLSAIKLTKQHVIHHVQQSTQEHSEQHKRTAADSKCRIT